MHISCPCHATGVTEILSNLIGRSSFFVITFLPSTFPGIICKSHILQSEKIRYGRGKPDQERVVLYISIENKQFRNTKWISVFWLLHVIQTRGMLRDLSKA